MKTCVVVFALPDRQRSWTVSLAEDADVAAALAAARAQAGDESVPWDADVGIFGESCERDAVPRDGDRIEIYRPLRSDPKESRRARAAARRRGLDPAAARLPTPKS
jgi:uncharacterized protein